MSCYYYENTNTFSIHIPKCAGGSFDRFIKNSKLINQFNVKSSYDICKLSHLTLEEFKTIIFKNPRKKLYESYRSFAFVRNPYSRALSIYFWVVKNSNSNIRQKMGIHDSNESVLKTSFFDFWSEYAFNDNRFRNLTKLQSDYIEENTIKFKIESISTLTPNNIERFTFNQYKQIYELIGAKIQKNIIVNPINYQRQKVHVNNYDKKIIYEDKKNLDLVKEIYKKDFENLGYSY